MIHLKRQYQTTFSWCRRARQQTKLSDVSEWVRDVSKKFQRYVFQVYNAHAYCTYKCILYVLQLKEALSMRLLNVQKTNRMLHANLQLKHIPLLVDY